MTARSQQTETDEMTDREPTSPYSTSISDPWTAACRTLTERLSRVFHPRPETVAGWVGEIDRLARGYRPEDIARAGDLLVDANDYFPKPREFAAALARARTDLAREAARAAAVPAPAHLSAETELALILAWLVDRAVPPLNYRQLVPGWEEMDRRARPSRVPAETLERVMWSADEAAIRAACEMICEAEGDAATKDPDVRDIRAAMARDRLDRIGVEKRARDDYWDRRDKLVDRLHATGGTDETRVEMVR